MSKNKRTGLLKLTDEVKKGILTPFKVQKDKKSLESWLIDRESEIATLEVDIEEAKAAEELDVDSILDKADQLELTKRRLTQGQDLLRELFEEPYTAPEEDE